MHGNICILPSMLLSILQVLTILSLISQLFLAGFLFRLYKKRSTQNGEGHQMNRLNNITYGLTLVIVFINVFIVAFEIKAV